MDNKIENVIKNLSINEKIEFLRGVNFWELKQDDRFGIKKLVVSDSTTGIRKEKSNGDGLFKESLPAICYPSASSLACSFDRDLLKNIGKHIAYEAKNKDINVVLGPGINIKRNPLCGRNFEYFSEDPYLTGELAASYIEGAEGEGVGTSIKHFAVNGSEEDRARINDVVDLRALHEIYLSAFKKAIIKSKPATVMASYNKINGFYGCENKYLLTDILKEKWGYEGAVVSDWAAINDPVLSIKNGLDLEMPNAFNINYVRLLEAYKNKEISEEDINKALRRVLKLIYKYQDSGYANVDMKKHHDFAVEAAEKSIVLLKNDEVLPLTDKDTILLLGELAVKPHIGGAGSAKINPYFVEDIFKSFEKHSDHVSYAKGFSYDDNENKNLLSEALELAKTKNKIVVFVGTKENEDSEGFDLTNASLHKNSLRLIEELSKVNKNIIVVIEAGNVKELPFKDNVKAILMTYLAGEGLNLALSNILYGKVNPSGKLSETFFKNVKDVPSYPYLKTNRVDAIHKDSIFVGYRYYNFNKDLINYPFGYGLSYSKLEINNVNLDKSYIGLNDDLRITFDITNLSNLDAQEVVQVYVTKPNDKVFSAAVELVGFTKLLVNANSTVSGEITLSREVFEYFDINLNDFRVQKGLYSIHVGNSSLNYAASFEVQVDGDDAISPYLLVSEINEVNSNLIETKLGARKYFEHNILDISNDEFKEIYKDCVLFDDRKDEKVVFDVNSSIILAKTYGSKGGKIIYKYLNMVPQIKKSKEMRNLVLETPLRQMQLFAGNILKEEDVKTLVDVFNDVKPRRNIVKVLRSVMKTYKKVNKK